MKPEEFWKLTPHETTVWCQAFSDREIAAYKAQLSAAWHSAAFARQKRLPSLKRLLTRMDKKEGGKPRLDDLTDEEREEARRKWTAERHAENAAMEAKAAAHAARFRDMTPKEARQRRRRMQWQKQSAQHE